MRTIFSQETHALIPLKIFTCMFIYLLALSQVINKQIIKLHVSVAIVCLLWVWPVCLSVGLLDLNRLSEGLEITSSLHWMTRGGQDTTRMKNGRKKNPFLLLTEEAKKQKLELQALQELEEAKTTTKNLPRVL